eukprot:CAMPEP_0202964194 /NCGR_PEP_ID=MMETSP1396-20130829/8274_1 /ASSEMBLY_ACC=CAM_ASM_000872 /TAXON_ID= /ORGANISM="Pseudokeronopsis sp., Strain Brazil" /LENGTH=237 /DNA_ID=CAMNT_0049686111 /DNA_START=19 /DNA_END=732 /DNA_ORIENTATION=-
MGCGASKGKEGGDTEKNEVDEIKFKSMNMWEVDDFFRKVSNFLDDFKGALDPYTEAKKQLYDITKFYEVPGAAPEQVFKGLFYSLVAIAGGDMSKLQLKFIPNPPFMDVSNDAFQGTNLFDFAIKVIATIIKFIKAVNDIVVENLPDLVKTAAGFPEEVEDVKNHAEHEFESLNPISKAKAIAALAQNIKTLQKVPDFVNKAADELKSTLEEIKKLMEDLKQNLEEYAKNGRTCFDQ